METKETIPSLQTELKNLATDLGADIVGFCRLPNPPLPNQPDLIYALSVGVKLADEERCLNDYLNDIKDHLEYKSWFFGHHHKDVEFEKHFGVYERVLTIGD